jgi:hypothetical protein
MGRLREILAEVQSEAPMKIRQRLVAALEWQDPLSSVRRL